jgi:uncharacterized protein (DUF983 family)
MNISSLIDFKNIKGALIKCQSNKKIREGRIFPPLVFLKG